MDLPVTGEKVPLGGTTAAERPELAGTVEVDELLEFAIPEGPLPGEKGWDPKTAEQVAVEGTLQASVVRTEKGTVDFHYRVTEVAPATRGIGWVLGYDYRDVGCDADYRTDGLGEVPPAFALRAPVTDKPPGSAVYFVWKGWEEAGLRAPSLFFFVKTDAKSYERADGAVAVAASGPEPAGVRLPGFRPS